MTSSSSHSSSKPISNSIYLRLIHILHGVGAKMRPRFVFFSSKISWIKFFLQINLTLSQIYLQITSKNLKLLR